MSHNSDRLRENNVINPIVSPFQMSNVQDARREMTKTKEQLEEEKRISLSIRIKPLDLSEMDSDQVSRPGFPCSNCSRFP